MEAKSQKPVDKMTIEEKVAEIASYFMDDRDLPSTLLEERCLNETELSPQMVAAAEGLISDDIEKVDDGATAKIIPIYQQALIKNLSVEEIDNILAIIKNPAIDKVNEIMDSTRKENEQMIHEIFKEQFIKNDLTNKFVIALERINSTQNSTKTKAN